MITEGVEALLCSLQEESNRDNLSFVFHLPLKGHDLAHEKSVNSVSTRAAAPALEHSVSMGQGTHLRTLEP